MSPQAKKRWQRFKALKRGYYSFIAICALITLSLFAELIASNRPLIISYAGQVYLPSYGDIIPGTEFNLGYDWETDYKELKQVFKDFPEKGNWLIMPIIPYSPLENHFIDEEYPPYAPNIEQALFRNRYGWTRYPFSNHLWISHCHLFLFILTGYVLRCRRRHWSPNGIPRWHL